jgi:ubiquinol-cytochrome c reductase cytochrome c1 subunit|tara:strand:- start:1849 stop:2514 length:666 start_codon:yes stop_codon:yes gene_type:complete
MKSLFAIYLIFAFISGITFAAGSMDLDEYIEGMNVKTSDSKSLQRGARNFFNYCSGCHTLQYMRYNQIAEDLRISEDQLIQNLIFTDSSPQDLVINNMLKEDGDRWFGKAPPDLTLVTRRKSPEYVYGLLNSFYPDDNSPTGVNNYVQEASSMPHVLWDLQERFTKEEYSRFLNDTVGFLVYAGEPIIEKRKSMGVWVIGFLLIFLIFSYALYKDIWREVK